MQQGWWDAYIVELRNYTYMKRDSSLRFFQTIEKVILFLYAFDVLFDKYVRLLFII